MALAGSCRWQGLLRGTEVTQEALRGGAEPGSQAGGTQVLLSSFRLGYACTQGPFQFEGDHWVPLSEVPSSL